MSTYIECSLRQRRRRHYGHVFATVTIVRVNVWLSNPDFANKNYLKSIIFRLNDNKRRIVVSLTTQIGNARPPDIMSPFYATYTTILLQPSANIVSDRSSTEYYYGSNTYVNRVYYEVPPISIPISISWIKDFKSITSLL